MSGIGHRMSMPPPGHPLIMEIEDRLSLLIGVLSKFIVERSFSQVTGGGSMILDEEGAGMMCRSILDEAVLLIGPARTEELNEEFDRLLRSYFKEGSKK